MSGCVSITAVCNDVTSPEAILIGIIGALIYKYTVALTERFHIDDPLHVSQVHGCSGLWGLIAAGLFSSDKGFFHTSDSAFLWLQCAGALAILLWTAFFSIIFFTLLKKTKRLRIGQVYEILGMDTVEDMLISQFSPELKLTAEKVSQIEYKQRNANY